MKIDHCRSCNAQIIWTETQNGKRMPVDAEPFPVGGSVWVDTTNAKSYTRLDAVPIGTEVRAGYVSHFASCPQANKWKKS